MALLRFDSTLLEVKELSPSVRHFTFSVPADFDFKPGQFVSAMLKDQDGTIKRRPYSIASSPQVKGKIDLCIVKVDGGIGSTFFFNMKPGDTVHFMGPMGVFTIKDEEPKVFIATGTGIAPFRAMITDLLAKGFSKEIMLLAGARHHVLYQDEFKQLAKQYPHFTYHPILSRPEKEYEGAIGRVQNLIDDCIPAEFTGTFYICGLWQMIQDVRELLLSRGYLKEQIEFERYD